MRTMMAMADVGTTKQVVCGAHETIRAALESMRGARRYRRYVVRAPGGGYYSSSVRANGAGHLVVFTVNKDADPTSL
jgi:hypothetical protein